ncbi:MAG: flagellin [Bosea sp. (in: a-proteobacteria)]
MASTILSSGVRNNLLTLQQTTAEQGVIQNRLATGKRVNSAIDSPINYFTSLNLNDRASQFSGLLDGISNGIQTIQAASKGIDAIVKLVQSAQSTIKQAQGDIGSRPSVTSTSAIGGATTVTSSTNLGKTLKETTLLAQLGAGAASAATVTPAAAQSLGGGAASYAVTITVGSNTYTDATLTATSTVQNVVDSINKSGLATATVGDDGKLTVKTTTSDKLQIGIGSGADATAATASSKTATNANALFGLDPTTATTGLPIVDSPVRTALVKQFNDLRTQIDQLAKDASYNGINLLTGDKLSIIFNEKTGVNQNKLDVQGQSIDSSSLGIKLAGTGTYDINFQSDSALATASDSLVAVITSLRSTASTFGANLGVVQTRQDFSKSMINVLKIGADNLVLADPNEEGASLLALNTRQQLSQTALSLANQADQGVLRLFG